MIKMSRLADYGIVLLTHFARHPSRGMRSARDLAAEAHLPGPTVSKLLKALARKGLLEAHRGARGGFSLARRPESISLGDIIDAIEGPVAITECSDASEDGCLIEARCPSRSTWRRVNQVVREALGHITLAEMAGPAPTHAVPVAFRV